MKKVCISCGHIKIEEITGVGLRSWRSSGVLKSSTGASGERDYHWEKVMPLLRDKLIGAGVQVNIATAIYEPWTYDQEYDLWISLHYDGGGTGERCMVSAPNRTTKPDYLNPNAQNEAERFAQIWKTTYPDIAGVPNRDDMVTSGMMDYYAFDYVGYDTPSVIVEHFNHTSSRGSYLKEHPELVAEGDFKAICKFLGIAEKPPVTSDTYKIIYGEEVLQEYEFNPSDRIQDLANELEQEKEKTADLTNEVGTLKANLADAENTLATSEAELTKARQERDIAKAALSTAENVIRTRDEEIKILNDQAEKFKAADPLAVYTWHELLSAGWRKWWSSKRR